jgi:hypothetical protein
MNAIFMNQNSLRISDTDISKECNQKIILIHFVQVNIRRTRVRGAAGYEHRCSSQQAWLRALMFSLLVSAQPVVYAADLPEWVSKERLAVVEKMGIDTKSDLQTKGNYHVGFEAKKEIHIGGYVCPAGSVVDVSRNIILVRPPDAKWCAGATGTRVQFLKVEKDGTAAPLSGK